MRTQRRNLLFIGNRPRRRNLALVRGGRNLDVVVLYPDERMLIQRGKRNAQPIVRQCHDEVSAIVYTVDAVNDRLLPHGILFDAPGACNQFKERPCTAVSDGRLLCIEHHAAVVNPVHMQCTHQMLNRKELQCPRTNCRCAHRRRHMCCRRRHRRHIRQIGARKQDPRPRRCRCEFHMYRPSRMQSNPIVGHPRRQCFLFLQA